jgi:drug/metabolite transporter (DMT)-like permease
MWRLDLAVAFAAMVSSTIAANLLLKLGSAPGEVAASGLISLKSALGALLFGCSLLLYMRILRSVPLNVAQSLMAAQFIGVILASAIVLSEPIPWPRWLGIALIATGIALVGSTLGAEN